MSALSTTASCSITSLMHCRIFCMAQWPICYPRPCLRTGAIAECAFWANVAAALTAALSPPLPAGAAARRFSAAGGPQPPGGSRRHRAHPTAPSAAAARAAVTAGLAGMVAPLLSEVASDMAGVLNNPQQVRMMPQTKSRLTARLEMVGWKGCSCAHCACPPGPRYSLSGPGHRPNAWRVLSCHTPSALVST